MTLHQRIGQGIDFHRLEEGRDLWLGGVRINSTKGCVAHSDGDVLIHAICDALLGAAGGTLEQISAAHIYAENIGLAFQVIDDILDTEADTATLGKTAGKDADSNKPTYVTILGLDVAKRPANQLHETAITALTPFGDQALRLRELANFITQRSF